jgi:hypothetical protein
MTFIFCDAGDPTQGVFHIQGKRSATELCTPSDLWLFNVESSCQKHGLVFHMFKFKQRSRGTQLKTSPDKMLGRPH